jgi:hypothetical protein
LTALALLFAITRSLRGLLGSFALFTSVRVRVSGSVSSLDRVALLVTALRFIRRI